MQKTEADLRSRSGSGAPKLGSPGHQMYRSESQAWTALGKLDCATAVNLYSGNAKKDRYCDILPFVNNRVILSNSHNVYESHYSSKATDVRDATDVAAANSSCADSTAARNPSDVKRDDYINASYVSGCQTSLRKFFDVKRRLAAALESENEQRKDREAGEHGSSPSRITPSPSPSPSSPDQNRSPYPSSSSSSSPPRSFSSLQQKDALSRPANSTPRTGNPKYPLSLLSRTSLVDEEISPKARSGSLGGFDPHDPFSQYQCRPRSARGGDRSTPSADSGARGTDNVFILTQAPVPTSLYDFFEMIESEALPLVVTLGASREGNREKMLQYWPENEGEELVFREEDFDNTWTRGRNRARYGGESDRAESKGTLGDKTLGRWQIRIRNLRTRHEQDCLVRLLSVKLSTELSAHGRNTAMNGSMKDSMKGLMEGNKEGVKERGFIFEHRHFIAWKDHSVPEDPTAFIAFVRDCRKRRQALKALIQGDGTAFEEGCVDNEPQIFKENLRKVFHRNAAARVPVIHCSAGVGRSGVFCAVDAFVCFAGLLDTRRSAESPLHERAESTTSQAIPDAQSQCPSVALQSGFSSGMTSREDGGNGEEESNRPAMRRNCIDLAFEIVRSMKLCRRCTVQTFGQFQYILTCARFIMRQHEPSQNTSPTGNSTQ